MRIIYVFRRDESILQMFTDARKKLQFFHTVHNINMPKSHCLLIIALHNQVGQQVFRE